MSVFNEAWDWFTTSTNWHGEDGIPHRLLQHIGYTALTTVIAVVIAVPLGLWIGHTGRLRGVAVALTGALYLVIQFARNSAELRIAFAARGPR